MVTNMVGRDNLRVTLSPSDFKDSVERKEQTGYQSVYGEPVGPGASAWEPVTDTLWGLMDSGRRACFLLRLWWERGKPTVGRRVWSAHTAPFAAPPDASAVKKGLSDETSSLGSSTPLPQMWLFQGNSLVAAGWRVMIFSSGKRFAGPPLSLAGHVCELPSGLSRVPCTDLFCKGLVA